MRVLLKPNMLLAMKPAKAAATTNPRISARSGQASAGDGHVKTVVLADSSGGLYTQRLLRKAYDACGFSSLLDLVDAEL